MATREENIKKINDELEQLSDDELEKVAGGSFSEDVAKKFQDMLIDFGGQIAKGLLLAASLKKPELMPKVEELLKAEPELVEVYNKMKEQAASSK